MFIALPALHLEHGSTEYSKDFLSDAKANNTDKIIVLRNNPPRWNEGILYKNFFIYLLKIILKFYEL